MGLESHIRSSMERAASGMVYGEDYWFEDGLTLATKDAAEKMAALLDESGEFGPTTVIEVPTPAYVTTREKTFKIEFDIHPMWHPGRE